MKARAASVTDCNISSDCVSMRTCRLFDRSATRPALGAGVTLFDTADVYGQSEDFLGQILDVRRDQVVIATKFGMDRRGANGPTGAHAARAGTSARPWRARCAGCAPTGSTCIRCTL